MTISVHNPPIAIHPNNFQTHNAEIPPPPPPPPQPMVHIEVSTFHFLILYFVQVPQQYKSPVAASKPDPYYRHENTAHLCTQFIMNLFACSKYPSTPQGLSTKLTYSTTYILHRTKLHSSVIFMALILLQHLKVCFPTAHSSSDHCLFFSAFMFMFISKVICDNTYSINPWSIVGQGMFQLHKINQMEHEMCQYLNLELSVEPGILKAFEDMACEYFAGPGPYPTYVPQNIQSLLWCPPIPSSAPISQGCSLCMCVVASKAQ